jgi:multiple antibiotic resistance protein
LFVVIFTIRAFVTFFTIIDPVGLAPVVIGLTAHLNDVQRKNIVTRAIVISAAIIAFFALVGRFLLDRLGISLYAFNIAGGALLFLVAVDMLFGQPSGVRETKTEAEEAMTREDISIFPLAIPMIAGPGTIATTILLCRSGLAQHFLFALCSRGHPQRIDCRLVGYAQQHVDCAPGWPHWHSCSFTHSGHPAGCTRHSI